MPKIAMARCVDVLVPVKTRPGTPNECGAALEKFKYRSKSGPLEKFRFNSNGIPLEIAEERELPNGSRLEKAP